MQKILCLLFVPLFYCCTTEPDSAAASYAVPVAHESYNKTDTPVVDLDVAANPANPYDLAGRLHCDVLEAYLPMETTACTIPQLIERLESAATGNSMFATLKSGGYDSPVPSRLQYLMNHPLLSRTEIVNGSGLTTPARNNLNDFISGVLQLREQQQPFAVSYASITAYETAVLSDPTFTTFDKQVLLSNASITRYGFYFASKHKKRKPRDRDWDHWITAISAGIEGSTQSMANAVMLSAAASALYNN